MSLTPRLTQFAEAIHADVQPYTDDEGFDLLRVTFGEDGKTIVIDDDNETFGIILDALNGHRIWPSENHWSYALVEHADAARDA